MTRPVFVATMAALVATVAATVAFALFPQAILHAVAHPVANPTAVSQVPNDAGWPADDYFHKAARLCGITATPMRKVGAPPAGFRLGDDRYRCGPVRRDGDWYLSIVQGGYCSMVHETDTECAKEIADADTYFAKRDADLRARPA